MDALLTEMKIGRYLDQAVCPELVRKLLMAAMAASSAGDQRPWHFVVVENQARRKQMAEILQPFAHMLSQAPVALVVCGDPTLQKHVGFWVQDCATAMQNILIESRALCLGAVWLRIYPVEGRVQKFRKLLDLPPHVIPFAVTPIGYPAEKSEPKCRYHESRVHFDCW
jgi:nitroreductase